MESYGARWRMALKTAVKRLCCFRGWRRDKGYDEKGCSIGLCFAGRTRISTRECRREDTLVHLRHSDGGSEDKSGNTGWTAHSARSLFFISTG